MDTLFILQLCCRPPPPPLQPSRGGFCAESKLPQDRPLVATAVYAATVSHLTSEVAFLRFCSSIQRSRNRYALSFKRYAAVTKKLPFGQVCLPNLKSMEREKEIFHLNNSGKGIGVKYISFKLNILYFQGWGLLSLFLFGDWFHGIFVLSPEGLSLLHSPVPVLGCVRIYWGRRRWRLTLHELCRVS